MFTCLDLAKGLVFLTTLEKCFEEFSGLKDQHGKTDPHTFFLNMSSLESKVTVSQKAKLKNRVLKKKHMPFSQTLALETPFVSKPAQSAGFAFISMNTPRQKLKFITNEGEAVFQVCCNAVCFLLRIESVARCVTQQSNF